MKKPTLDFGEWRPIGTRRPQNPTRYVRLVQKVVEVVGFRRYELPGARNCLGWFRGFLILTFLLRMEFSILDLVNSKKVRMRNRLRVQASSLESGQIGPGTA